MISLIELVKKRKGEVADEKVNCRKSKVLFGGCVSIFYNDQRLIFIPYANKVLADYGKVQFLTKKLSLTNKNTAFQTSTVPNQIFSSTSGTPNR